MANGSMGRRSCSTMPSSNLRRRLPSGFNLSAATSSGDGRRVCRLRSGQERPAATASFLQSLVEAICDGSEDFDAREVLVVTFDQRPRGNLRAGTSNHVVDGDGVVPPPFPVPPIFVGDLPALIAGVAAIAKASQLFAFA